MTVNIPPASLDLGSKRIFFPNVNKTTDIGAASTRLRVRLEKMVKDIGDTRRNGRLTDEEARAAVQEITATAIRETEEIAKQIEELAWKTDLMPVDISFIKPAGSSTSYYDALVDLDLAREFRSMSPRDRTVLLAKLQHEPTSVLRWAEALTRLPTEATGLDVATQNMIRNSATKAFAPEAWAGYEAAAAEAASARETIVTAARTLRELAPAVELAKAATLGKAAGLGSDPVERMAS